MSLYSRHGASFFSGGRNLSLQAALREMRSTYRHEPTKQIYSRYCVAVVVTLQATGHHAIDVKTCHLLSQKGQRVELARFENSQLMVEPGQPPKSVALDASKLWQHGARRVDFLDEQGHRWSVNRRSIRKLMDDYEDRAATVDQMNAAESFTQSWQGPESAGVASP